ncbi:MAG: hypothetical protein AAGL29_03700 [Bacteroidota bacterium]
MHHDRRGQVSQVVRQQQEAIEVIVLEPHAGLPVSMLDQEIKTIVPVEVRELRQDQALPAEPTVPITTRGLPEVPAPTVVVPQQGVHPDMEPTVVRVVINPIAEPHHEVATTPNHVVAQEAREAMAVQVVPVEATEALEVVRVAQVEAMAALEVALEARAATEALAEVVLLQEGLLQVEVEAAEDKEHNYISR